VNIHEVSNIALIYYGKKFLETYVESGGEALASNEVIDYVLEDAVIRGAKYAAMGSAPTPAPVCSCAGWANDSWTGQAVTFTCPVHGTVTVDRRIPHVVTIPSYPFIAPLPYTPPPTPSIPNQPWGPTWTGGNLCDARDTVTRNPAECDFRHK
jgi:hypothetical protein